MLTLWLSRVVCNVLSNLYPAWASYHAVSSGDSQQHRQWLSYWVVNTFFIVFEMLGDRLISWLPLYYEAKIAFIVWLTLPQFNGASILYSRVVAGYLELIEPNVDILATSAQQRMGEAWNIAGRNVANHVRSKSAEILMATTQLLAETAKAASSSPAPSSDAPTGAPEGPAAAAKASSTADGARRRKPL